MRLRIVLGPGWFWTAGRRVFALSMPPLGVRIGEASEQGHLWDRDLFRVRSGIRKKPASLKASPGAHVLFGQTGRRRAGGKVLFQVRRGKVDPEIQTRDFIADVDHPLGLAGIETAP